MGSPAAGVRAVSTEQEAVAALKAWKPYALHVVTVDGLERDVAISTRRNRWKVAAQILAGMPWVTIEARDRKGAILGLLQREEEVDQADDASEEPDKTAVTIREAQLLELMLKAQKTALDGQTNVLRPFLESTTRLISSMTDRVTRLEDELYQRASELRRLMADAGGGGDDEGKGGLMSTEMIGMLLRLASGGGGLGGGGGPTRPPPATSAPKGPGKRQGAPGAKEGPTVVGQPPPGAKDAGGGGGTGS
jgi:hypothetical protein